MTRVETLCIDRDATPLPAAYNDIGPLTPAGGAVLRLSLTSQVTGHVLGCRKLKKPRPACKDDLEYLYAVTLQPCICDVPERHRCSDIGSNL